MCKTHKTPFTNIRHYATIRTDDKQYIQKILRITLAKSKM